MGNQTAPFNPADYTTEKLLSRMALLENINVNAMWLPISVPSDVLESLKSAGAAVKEIVNHAGQDNFYSVTWSNQGFAKSNQAPDQMVSQKQDRAFSIMSHQSWVEQNRAHNRQIALQHAMHLGEGSTPDDVIRVARNFEGYLNGTDDATTEARENTTIIHDDAAGNAQFKTAL